MPTREIYPGAPLASVAFELRHPEAEPLAGALRSDLQKKLASRYPLMRSHRNITQSFELGPKGPESRSVVEEFPRFLDRRSSISASFTATSILLETSRYGGWDDFRSSIEYVCEIRNSLSPIYGVERLGLRYVDEVRVDDIEGNAWGNWIHPSLLAGEMADSSGLPLRLWQGALVYGSEPGQGLVLRYGPGDGYATDPNGELKRQRPTAPGPFFLLDVDSFWQPENDVPEYNIDAVLAQLDELHTPVREVFESSITDEYREKVLRK
ncbi:TIGR04255 family protein [Salinibacterium amurskyense]|uniref:TIGR04255 family protein n=1 Tax=Salinibacterium amurskyense TaxID=205941 RepID=UPI00311F3C9B